MRGGRARVMARVARRAYPVSCLGAVRVSVQQVLHLRFRVVVGNGIVQRQTSHLMRSNSWAWEGVLWAGLTSVGVHTSSAVVARVERSVAAAPQPRASPRSRAACTALGTNWSARLALALASPLIFCFMVRVASPHFKIAAGSRTLLRTTATPAAYFTAVCYRVFWPQFAPVGKTAARKPLRRVRPIWDIRGSAACGASVPKVTSSYARARRAPSSARVAWPSRAYKLRAACGAPLPKVTSSYARARRAPSSARVAWPSDGWHRFSRFNGTRRRGRSGTTSSCSGRWSARHGWSPGSVTCRATSRSFTAASPSWARSLGSSRRQSAMG